MKQRSAALVLSLAVWSCALQPAAGPRPGPGPEVAEARGGAAPQAGVDVEPLADGASVGEGGAAAGEGGAVVAVNGERADAVVASAAGASRADEARTPEADEEPPLWVDPRIDLEYLALRVLAEANAVRMRAGAGPLVMDPALRRAARRYSRELALRGEIEHLSPTPGRRTFRQRIAAEGAEARVAGENLARLTASVESLPRRAVQAWMKSPGHRRNLLDPIFTRTGIGVMLGPDGIWYVVQVYATPT
ncbi:MAG: CAP domain-containing protein [bacterium]|jgi:uncharacterized protein YkwD|nr:MAG: hypothetical protein DIU52_02120 [bacterium]